jgi:hypothetical protein
MATDLPKELFELNSNDIQSWAADKDAFLKSLCDHVDDSMGGEEESCGLSHLDKESEQEDFGMGFEESGQEVFRMPVPRQQRAKDDQPDEVVRQKVNNTVLRVTTIISSHLAGNCGRTAPPSHLTCSTCANNASPSCYPYAIVHLSRGNW